ncbi:MAG: DNA recombination/repair protein RecA, partial [Cyanobacteria bacterium J06635_11]
MAKLTANPTQPLSMPTSEKQQALGRVLTQIERNFGQGSIMRLGEAQRLAVQTIPSGALPLDIALGGGLPRGRIIE